MIQNLRKLALTLEVSGTTTAVENTKLYQGGYGFVLLSVYVPVTPNRDPALSPLLTVYRTVIDDTGMRTQYKNDVYTLLYVGRTHVDGFEFMVFETAMPRAFTTVVGDLELVFNYVETADVPVLDDNGDPTGDTKTVIKYRLTTNIFATTVSAGGVPETDLDLDIDSALVAQVNANTIAIELLNDIVNNDVPMWIAEAVDNHNISGTAHQDIRDIINSIDLGDGITIPILDEYIADGIATHNTADDSHQDIRAEISDNTDHLTDVDNELTNIESSVASIAVCIPSVASTSNKLVDRNTLVQAIVTSEADFLTFDASGNLFPTKADLDSATTFYHQSAVVVPTNNDYTNVIADETQGSATTRYSYDGSQWLFNYVISPTPFTTAQQNAIDSGIDATKVAQIATNTTNIATNGTNIASHTGNTTIHVTQADKDKWNAIAPTNKYTHYLHLIGKPQGETGSKNLICYFTVTNTDPTPYSLDNISTVVYAMGGINNYIMAGGYGTDYYTFSAICVLNTGNFYILTLRKPDVVDDGNDMGTFSVQLPVANITLVEDFVV